ncbi:hypothetical protein [Rodentibacter myodis]|uniref:Uncharacterized protein n=1 Tax=Rodentibacter myodis TaxID=1907939 RepID=A0A1V3JS42_9PAST|nr:hypothetical protein [Rodentibacter myodis]OOF59467.1 hypothetical protein BKL49_03190 [Rodentibacter myodis]
MFNFNHHRSYTPDTISRNIKRVKNDVIEVCRYSDAKFKQFVWLWIIAIIGIASYNITSENNIYKDIKWALAPDEQLQKQYNRLTKVYKSHNKIEQLEQYSEYRKDMLSRHTGSTYVGFFYILFPIFLLLLLISPNWRPLRIDTNRRIAYFWLFGKFYITRYDERTNPLNALKPYSYQSRLTNPEHAALVLTLPHETDPNNIVRVDLGIYRPACDYQDQVLKDFLTDYMQSPNPDQEFAHYFKKEKRLWSDYINWFYHFSLFPTRGYNEKKTEAKIQQWLTNNPEIY